MKKLSLVMVCLLMLSAFAISPAMAAGFPERPITLMVGFAPGGSLDLSARALAAAAEKILGQPIAVENKTGGTGSVALAALLNSKPDGYTLVVTPSSVLVRVSQMQAFPFKPLKAFKSIIGYGTPELGIVVKSDAPWKTLKELVEFAKKNPGKIKYATTGVGSTTHAAVEEIIVKDGVEMIHIPYKGSIEAITALLGGHVDMASVTSEFIPSVQGGQTRLLATMGEKRAAKFLNAPTMKEAGYDFVNDAVYAVVAPATLPADIAKKLEEAFAKAGENKEYRDALDKVDLTPVYYNGKAFDDFLKMNWKKINKHLIQSGLIKETATQPE
ncbi:MAG: tripartite tricarboxylate transporter substrate binding protein [Desulfobacteraceae bacterium]|nr:MAG: tripartite tricarboxylate transporter substrate binding protein [Desulfobacteraceae bacterium]